MLTLNLKVHNETSNLKSVYVGIADDFENTPKKEDCYDPKSLFHVQNGTFPNQVDLINENKSDTDPRKNAPYLDCCFQPIGCNKAILYKEGFKHKKDIKFLVNYFVKENIIETDSEEMYNMNSNVFSLSEKIIVSDKSFTRLNLRLKELGFVVEEISYMETSKMEGLFRCSTMPLIRE